MRATSADGESAVPRVCVLKSSGFSHASSSLSKAMTLPVSPATARNTAIASPA
jgi:hypothetical protein